MGDPTISGRPPSSPQTTAGGKVWLARPARSALAELIGQTAAGAPDLHTATTGLLLGCAEKRTELLGIEPVPVDPAGDRSRRLSAADEWRIRKAVASLRTRAPILGCFRAQTRGELEPQSSDTRMAALLGCRHPVLLLIDASARQPGPARLYRLESGHWRELARFAIGSEEPEATDRAAQEPAGVRAPARWRTVAIGFAAIMLLGAMLGGAAGYLAGRYRAQVAPEAPGAAPTLSAAHATTGAPAPRGAKT